MAEQRLTDTSFLNHITQNILPTEMTRFYNLFFFLFIYALGFLFLPWGPGVAYSTGFPISVSPLQQPCEEGEAERL